ncbi:MAG: hypothetical protein ACXVAN_17855 [Polyangia bacterium]
MRTARTPAALGFRAHTGWAALTATAGPASSPTVLHRARVEMIAGHTPNAPPYVYHAAAQLSLPAAERLVRASEAQARAHATAAIAAALRTLAERGFAVVASGVIGGNRALTSPLEAILRAHALIHAAEGELYRQAIAGASEACGVPVTIVPARELWPRATRQLRVTEERLRARLAEAGRGAGRPWAQDQKESLLVALLALGAAAIR